MDLAVKQGDWVSWVRVLGFCCRLGTGNVAAGFYPTFGRIIFDFRNPVRLLETMFLVETRCASLRYG
jgi:hypothetical protein